jgi:hypothetical protein
MLKSQHVSVMQDLQGMCHIKGNFTLHVHKNKGFKKVKTNIMLKFTDIGHSVI